MKILMALDYYRPNYSGLTLFAEQLAGGLARRGHAVSVLTHRHLPELPPDSEEDGVRVIRAAVAGRMGKALVSPAILARALAEVPRSDVLHLHAPLVNAVPLALIASTLRVPIVVTYHCDLQPPSGLVQRFVEVVARASQHFALERASRVITNTEDYARHTRPLSERAEKVGWILPPVQEPADHRALRRRSAPAVEDRGPAGRLLPGPVRRGEGTARPVDGVLRRAPPIPRRRAGARRRAEGGRAKRSSTRSRRGSRIRPRA